MRRNKVNEVNEDNYNEQFEEDIDDMIPKNSSLRQKDKDSNAFSKNSSKRSGGRNSEEYYEDVGELEDVNLSSSLVTDKNKSKLANNSNIGGRSNNDGKKTNESKLKQKNSDEMSERKKWDTKEERSSNQSKKEVKNVRNKQNDDSDVEEKSTKNNKTSAGTNQKRKSQKDSKKEEKDDSDKYENEGYETFSEEEKKKKRNSEEEESMMIKTQEDEQFTEFSKKKELEKLKKKKKAMNFKDPKIIEADLLKKFSKLDKNLSYVKKFENLLGEKNYYTMSEAQIKRENEHLREALKGLNEELSKIVEKESTKINSKIDPVYKTPEFKSEIMERDINNNERIIKNLTDEYKKIVKRIEQISLPTYLNEIDKEIEETRKEIKETRKTNRSFRFDANKSGKDINTIEDNEGVPEDLKKAYEIEEEIAIFESKNFHLKKRIDEIEVLNQEISSKSDKLLPEEENAMRLAEREKIKLSGNPLRAKFKSLEANIKTGEELLKLMNTRHLKTIEGFNKDFQGLKNTNQEHLTALEQLKPKINEENAKLEDLVNSLQMGPDMMKKIAVFLDSGAMNPGQKAKHPKKKQINYKESEDSTSSEQFFLTRPQENTSSARILPTAKGNQLAKDKNLSSTPNLSNVDEKAVKKKSFKGDDEKRKSSSDSKGSESGKEKKEKMGVAQGGHGSKPNFKITSKKGGEKQDLEENRNKNKKRESKEIDRDSDETPKESKDSGHKQKPFEKKDTDNLKPKFRVAKGKQDQYEENEHQSGKGEERKTSGKRSDSESSDNEKQKGRGKGGLTLSEAQKEENRNWNQAPQQDRPQKNLEPENSEQGNQKSFNFKRNKEIAQGQQKETQPVLTLSDKTNDGGGINMASKRANMNNAQRDDQDDDKNKRQGNQDFRAENNGRRNFNMQNKEEEAYNQQASRRVNQENLDKDKKGKKNIFDDNSNDFANIPEVGEKNSRDNEFVEKKDAKKLAIFQKDYVNQDSDEDKKLKNFKTRESVNDQDGKNTGNSKKKHMLMGGSGNNRAMDMAQKAEKNEFFDVDF